MDTDAFKAPESQVETIQKNPLHAGLIEQIMSEPTSGGPLSFPLTEMCAALRREKPNVQRAKTTELLAYPSLQSGLQRVLRESAQTHLPSPPRAVDHWRLLVWLCDCGCVFGFFRVDCEPFPPGVLSHSSLPVNAAFLRFFFYFGNRAGAVGGMWVCECDVGRLSGNGHILRTLGATSR